MNRKLFITLAVTLISWILFLNGHEIIAALILFGMSLYLIFSGVLSEAWRFLSVSLLFGIFFHLILMKSNIPLFFPNMAFFLYVLSLNAGILTEMVSRVSVERVYPVFLTSVVTMILFYTVAWILPEDWYTLFTKASLYDLVSFIFLPANTLYGLRILNHELKEKGMISQGIKKEKIRTSRSPL